MPELTSQKWSHTEEKSFNCGFCQKEFAHLSGLTRHKWSHTGEKPFRCGLCQNI